MPKRPSASEWKRQEFPLSIHSASSPERTPDKERPVLVLSRQDAIELLHTVIVVPITSTIRGRSQRGGGRSRREFLQEVLDRQDVDRGRPTPRSDADILVVLQSSTIERARDRIPEVLAAMSPLPCPVDLFVWTRDELERFTRTGEPLAREAMEHGIDLLV
jgi:hypothetical protein